MAGLSTDGGGLRTIQIRIDGKRQSIRLGRCAKRDADKAKAMIEALLSARQLGAAPDPAAAAWLESIGATFRGRLAAVGLTLTTGRETLPAFLDRCLSQAAVRESTRVNMGQTARLLVDRFGNIGVHDVTPAAADAWVAEMRRGRAEASVSRHIKRARQWWRIALRWGLTARNPFDGIRGGRQHNPERSVFVPREWVAAMLDNASPRWQAIIALSRFGGLRVPSEIQRLTWADFAADRFTVDAPKSGKRSVPLFPELAEVLGPPATGLVVERVAGASNLRTNLHKIIRRAGLAPWPRPFHNMRASRQTELTETFPEHVVCAWLGNSPNVARKHYLQVRDEDFTRAVKSGGQGAQTAVNGRQPAQENAYTFNTFAESSDPDGVRNRKRQTLKFQPKTTAAQVRAAIAGVAETLPLPRLEQLLTYARSLAPTSAGGAA